MARDQYQRVRPGETLPGLPSQPFNDMLDALKASGVGARRAGEHHEAAIEVMVVNSTGGALARGSVLQVNAPVTTKAQDLSQFLERDALRGVAPGAGQPFVILQEAVAAGQIGWARLLGLVRVQVNMIDAAHILAAPTTGDMAKLTSGTTGSAVLVWQDPTVAIPGVRWCVVVLTGQPSKAGDRFEVVRPNNSGVTPPSIKLFDGQVDILDLTTLDLNPSELCWYRDANNPA